MEVNSTQRPIARTSILAGAACLCAVLVFLASPALQLGASLLLVFYLPGWALLQALAPRQKSRLSALVFALGMSLTVTILAGLVLHLVGAMSRSGWAAALLAATLGGCVTAHARRRPPLLAGASASVRPRLGPAQSAMLIGAVLLTLGAVLLARTEALGRHEFAYTEFWMVPDGDGLLAVGIKNEEASPSRYEVEVDVNGTMVRRWSGIGLDVGKSWTADFLAPIGEEQSRSAHGAEARLFKDGDRQRVYRRVWLPASGRTE